MIYRRVPYEPLFVDPTKTHIEGPSEILGYHEWKSEFLGESEIVYRPGKIVAEGCAMVRRMLSTFALPTSSAGLLLMLLSLSKICAT
jgi:hypothetical protein